VAREASVRDEQFKAFLGERGEADPAAVCAIAASIESRLGFRLDNADLGRAGIDALVMRLGGKAEDRAALEAYAGFTAYFKAR
jgi:hypothetical protein